MRGVDERCGCEVGMRCVAERCGLKVWMRGVDASYG